MTGERGYDGGVSCHRHRAGHHICGQSKTSPDGYSRTGKRATACDSPVLDERDARVERDQVHALPRGDRQSP